MDVGLQITSPGPWSKLILNAQCLDSSFIKWRWKCSINSRELKAASKASLAILAHNKNYTDAIFPLGDFVCFHCGFKILSHFKQLLTSPSLFLGFHSLSDGAFLAVCQPILSKNLSFQPTSGSLGSGAAGSLAKRRLQTNSLGTLMGKFQTWHNPKGPLTRSFYSQRFPGGRNRLSSL